MKLLIAFIDGADPEYIKKGIQKGILKNMKNLSISGSFNKLKSVFPPFSIPAMPSLYTGKNPGKLGFFDCASFENYNFKVETWQNSEKKLWNYLCDENKKVAIINLFESYPAEKVNGIMLADVDHMTGEKISYPKEIKEEIIKELGNLEYEKYIPYYRAAEKELLELRQNLVNNQEKLFKFISKKGDFEVVISAYNVDQFNHFFPDEKKIIEGYSIIDKAIGNFFKIFDTEGKANKMIFSDHGGGPITTEFYVNEWLKKEGFLKLKKEKVRNFGAESIVSFLQFLKIDLIVAKILPYSIQNKIKEKLPKKIVRFQDAEIDWVNTVAYSSFPSSGSIRINLKGREPEGVVSIDELQKIESQIKERLKSFCNEQNVKIDFFNKYELYSGKYADKAPEINYIIDEMKFQPKINFCNEILKKARDYGSHRYFGTLIVSGINFKKTNKKINASLLDILPTIFYLLSMDIPEEFDGKVLFELVNPGYLKFKKTKSYGEKDKLKQRISELIKLRKI